MSSTKTQRPILMRQSNALLQNMQELLYLESMSRSLALASFTDVAWRTSPVRWGFTLTRVSGLVMLTLPLFLRHGSCPPLPDEGVEAGLRFELGVDVCTIESRTRIATYLTSSSTTLSKDPLQIRRNNRLLIGMGLRELAHIYWQQYMMKSTYHQNQMM